jgi:hypothetical protein
MCFNHTKNVLLSLATVLSLGGLAQAQTYVFHDLGAVYNTKFETNDETNANGINKRRVVGHDITSGHGLLWDYTDINNIGIYDLSPATSLVTGNQFLFLNGITGNRVSGVGFDANGAVGLVFNIKNLNSIVAYSLKPSATSFLGANAQTYTNQINSKWVVGDGFSSSTGGNSRAIAWNIKNLNSIQAVNLHTVAASVISGTSTTGNTRTVGLEGDKASGYGNNGNGIEQAILWQLPTNGQALAAYNLTNALIPTLGAGTNGIAIEMTSNRVIGYAFGPNSGGYNAIVWNTNDLNTISHANLNPSAAAAIGGVNVESVAFGIAGNRVVGTVSGSALGSSQHAIVWNIKKLSAPVATDLHTFIGAGFVSSEAKGVSKDGDISGNAVDSNGITHAFLLEKVAN